MPNKGPYSAPMLMVKKKDGTWRLVVDYRETEQGSRKEAHKIPRIHDLVDRTAGSDRFSAFDCKTGYWQWLLHPDSIEKTGFSMPFRSFCFTVCPMGFTNSTQGFHQVINEGIR